MTSPITGIAGIARRAGRRSDHARARSSRRSRRSIRSRCRSRSASRSTCASPARIRLDGLDPTRKAERRADPRRRQRLPGARHRLGRQSRGRRQDRHDDDREPVPEPEEPAAAGPVREGARGDRDASAARWSFRSVRCRSSRAPIRWRSSTPTTRSRCAAVKAGARADNLWVIDEGLKPGERVIVEGVQKVRDGVTVNPVTDAAVAAGAAELVAEPSPWPSSSSGGRSSRSSSRS